MRIHKCDRCKKIITDETTAVAVAIGGFFPRHELCGACGRPIVTIITRYKLAT